MGNKLIKIENSDREQYGFHCPGCRSPQLIPTKKPEGWDWNGSLDRPTFQPSILTKRGERNICHSYVTDGKIQFLSDCTHEFAGQTLELRDVEKFGDLFEEG